jgi:hypothetical protein
MPWQEQGQLAGLINLSAIGHLPHQVASDHDVKKNNMRYDQYNQLPHQRRRRNWISFLFPLTFLLIFAFTQSLAGLFTSLAIIVLLWVLLAAASPAQRRRQPPLMQQPAASLYEPEVERPYEQGYPGAWNTGGQFQPVAQGTETGGEGDRLAQLQLLGDLYHAGILTQDEFTRQKRQVLQDDGVFKATEPKDAPALESESQHEEMLISYPQE